MVEETSVYDSRGVRTRLRDFTKSLFKVLEVETNESDSAGPDLAGPDGIYKGFRISLIGTREKGRGLELRVDIGCDGEDPERANSKAEELLDYTKWFDGWDIFSQKRNGSGINLPTANRPDLERLKGCLQFVESEKSPSMPLVTVYYSFGRPFLEKEPTGKGSIARLAFRVLVAGPLIYWIDKKASE